MPLEHQADCWVHSGNPIQYWHYTAGDLVHSEHSEQHTYSDICAHVLVYSPQLQGFFPVIISLCYLRVNYVLSECHVLYPL